MTDETARARQQITGDTAIAVAQACTTPLRDACERLALLVDGLERFVTTSSGPEPYPYRSLQTLRNDLTQAYLQATSASRALIDLDSAIAATGATTLDVRREVELAVSMAQHQLDARTELMVDVVDVPLALGPRGVLALAVAQLITISAASAAQVPGSTLTVRVTCERNSHTKVIVVVADNGSGFVDMPPVVETISTALQVSLAEVTAATTIDQGCAFELSFYAA
jgi:hypothetical protein